MVNVISGYASVDAAASTYDSYFGVESNLIFCLLFSMLKRKTPDEHHVVRGIFQKLMTVRGVDVNAKIKIKPHSHLSKTLSLAGVAEISPLALTLYFFGAPYDEKLTASSAIYFSKLLIDAGADVNETIVQCRDGQFIESRLVCFFCDVLFKIIKAHYRDAERASIERRALLFPPLKVDFPEEVVSVFQILFAAGAAAHADAGQEYPTEQMSLSACVLNYAIAGEKNF